MDKTRRYEFEGIVLEIPLYFDEKSQMYIEDYPDFIENPVWTARGHRVLFSGTDACGFAEAVTQRGCADCGACKYYKSAGEHTWFGVCMNEKNKKDNNSVKEEQIK